MQRLVPFLAAFLVPGCATLSSGAFQTVTILSEPPGAACTVTRNGEIIAALAATPGPVRIRRSVHDAEIRCTLPGHAPAVATLPARFQTGQAIGNIVTVGAGLLVDARSGALGRYPAYAQVAFQQVAPPPAPEQAEAVAPAPRGVARLVHPAGCNPETEEDCPTEVAAADPPAPVSGVVKHKQAAPAPASTPPRRAAARTAEAGPPQPASPH